LYADISGEVGSVFTLLCGKYIQNSTYEFYQNRLHFVEGVTKHFGLFFLISWHKFRLGGICWIKLLLDSLR